MELLIKDQDGGGGVADISNAFSSLGLVSSNTNVNNELISLSSPAVMYEVVKNLGLDVNYSTRADSMRRHFMAAICRSMSNSMILRNSSVPDSGLNSGRTEM